MSTEATTEVKTMHKPVVQIIGILVGMTIITGAVVGGTLALENYVAESINEWFNPPEGEEENFKLELDLGDVVVNTCPEPVYTKHDAATFEEANAICQAAGLEIASINSDEDYTALYDTIGES